MAPRQVTEFMRDHVYPAEAAVTQLAADAHTKWTIPPGMQLLASPTLQIIQSPHG